MNLQPYLKKRSVITSSLNSYYNKWGFFLDLFSERRNIFVLPLCRCSNATVMVEYMCILQCNCPFGIFLSICNILIINACIEFQVTWHKWNTRSRWCVTNKTNLKTNLDFLKVKEDIVFLPFDISPATL